MIRGSVEGDDKVIAHLLKIEAGMVDRVRETVGRATLKLQRKIQAEKLSGQVLKVRTGNLRRSINHAFFETGSTATGVVSTNVKYGLLHERGGTIRAHVVEVKKAKALRFMIGGRVVFAKRVQIPAVKYPERSFMRSALSEFNGEFIADLSKAVSLTIKASE